MRALAALLLTTAVLPAAAQTTQTSVWRCGPEGRTFQATPCAEGQVLGLRPAPDAEAHAEARAVAARERQGLALLTAQRREREAAAVGAAGVRPSRAAPEGCGTSPSAARASPRAKGPRGCS